MRQPRAADEQRRMTQHERQHADVFAGQQRPARRGLGQQHADAAAVEKAGQEAGRPNERQQQAERVGHAAGQNQLQKMNRALGVAGQRNPNRAEGQRQIAGNHHHARLLQLRRVVASGSLRGRKSGFSPGSANCTEPVTPALAQTPIASMLTPSRIQQMP